MNTGQIQVRISLPDQLYQYLLGQSSRLGIPVTQVVKHMVIEKAQKDEFPTYLASAQTEQSYHDAITNIDKATVINNSKELKTFFDSL